jgi:hypothetical protein
VLLLMPFPKGLDRTYRDARRSYLEACCMVAKLMNPNALDIVGFATETARGAEGSEDAIYLDARDWTPALDEEARQLQRDLEILVSPRMMRGTEYEYPPARCARLSCPSRRLRMKAARGRTLQCLITCRQSATLRAPKTLVPTMRGVNASRRESALALARRLVARGERQ